MMSNFGNIRYGELQMQHQSYSFGVPAVTSQTRSRVRRARPWKVILQTLFAAHFDRIYPLKFQGSYDSYLVLEGVPRKAKIAYSSW